MSQADLTHTGVKNLTNKFEDFDIESLSTPEDHPAALCDSKMEAQKLFEDPDKFDSLKWIWKNEDLSLSDDPSLDLNLENNNGEGGIAKEKEEAKVIPWADQPQFEFTNNSPTSSPSAAKPLRKRPGRKKIHTGLNQRKDVILKKMLRRIRAYYWKRFNSITKYNVRKRSFQTSDFFYDWIRFFLLHEMKITNPKEQMVKSLGDIMWIKENGGKTDNEVYLVLYKFSFKRFTKLAENPHFQYFVKTYAKQIEAGNLTSDEKIALKMILNEC